MDKFRVFGVDTKRLSDERLLVSSPQNKSSTILSRADARCLFSCQDFKSLSAHAISHVEEIQRERLEYLADSAPIRGLFSKLTLNILNHTDIETPVSDGDVARVEERLRKFAAAGFLVSESDLQTRLIEASEKKREQDSDSSVESLGIPTKNRPILLKRALSSHIEELKQQGRKTELVILDDSDNDEHREYNRAVIKQIKDRYSSEIRYADRERRSEYARQVAEVSGTDPEIAHFALVGDSQYATYGGPRNAHLLDSIGRCCLQVDDDVIGGTLTVPDRKSGLEIGSRAGDVHQFWFFQNESAAFDFPVPAEIDILSAHEEMLGQSIANTVKSTLDQEHEELSINHMNSSLLQDIERRGARFAVSLAGTTGDSAMPNHIDTRLLQTGDSFNRILGSGREEYESNLTTRYIMRSPRRKKVLSGGFLMSTIIGFDCRSTIPPFMVPGRNTEGTFGAVIQNVMQSSHVGYVPYVFQHAPSEERQRATLDEVTGPLKFRVNDFLISVINDYGDTNHIRSDTDGAILDLGRYLIDISKMNNNHFNSFIQDKMSDMIVDRIQYSKRRLSEEVSSPSYWKQHLRTLIHNYEKMLKDRLLFMPIDLDGRPQKRTATTKHFFNKYGRLLKQWPAMMDGARKLRTDGNRVSQAI